MNPIALILGAGAAAVGAYKVYMKGKVAPPTAGSFQTQSLTSSSGVPVKVMTPIPRNVTSAQRTGIPSSPPVAARAAQPQVLPGGTVFVPPKAITQIGPGKFEMAPIIMTPTGAASVAISTIKDVQRALNTLGYVPRLVEDDKYGPKTAANIRQFQSKSGLAADGNAGPATKAALSNALQGFASSGGAPKVAATAPRAVTPVKPVYSTLSQTELGPYDTAPNRAGAAAQTAVNAASMTGRDVQRLLNLAGASPRLVEDGAIGPKSVAAIKSFQMSHGLVPDGVAGPKTKAALLAATGNSSLAAGEFGSQWC